MGKSESVLGRSGRSSRETHKAMAPSCFARNARGRETT